LVQITYEVGTLLGLSPSNLLHALGTLNAPKLIFKRFVGADLKRARHRVHRDEDAGDFLRRIADRAIEDVVD